MKIAVICLFFPRILVSVIILIRFSSIIDPHIATARAINQSTASTVTIPSPTQTIPEESQTITPAIHKSQAKTKRSQPTTPINFLAIEQSIQLQVQQIYHAQPLPNPQQTPAYGFLFHQIVLQPTQENTFRFGLPQLIELGNILSQKLGSVPRRGQSDTLIPHEKLLVYLTYLSTQTTQRFLSSKLGISSILF